MFKYAFFVMLVLVFFISGCSEYKPLEINNAYINKKISQIDKKTLESNPNGRTILSKLEDDEPLNESDISSLALLLNPTLKIERDNLQIAKAQINSSKTIPNPSISVDTGFPISGNIVNTYNSYSIGLSYPISWIFSHSSEVKIAVLEYEAKKLNYDFNAYQIMQDAKITAANVYYLEQILKQLLNKLNLYKEIYDTVKIAYTKQLVSLNDLQLAKNEYETAKLKYLDTKNLLNKQNYKLKEILGLPLNVNLKVNFKPYYALKLPPLKELYKNIENRLDIVAYRLAYQAQEERTRFAFVKQFPRISINFPFSRDTSNVQTLGVGISIDFPIFNTNEAQIYIQEATRKKMYDEYVYRIATAKFDIKRLVSDMENIQKVTLKPLCTLVKIECAPL